MCKGIFITGTDTDVGKTWVGSQIAAALHENKIPLCVRKPIESGCSLRDGELIPADATQYWQAIQQSDSLENICPYRFIPAISPALAAAQQHIRISLDQLLQTCKTANDELLLLEGAGGFYSPLYADGLNKDLAVALQLPVVLVVADKLGCINHTLLSLKAITGASLDCQLIILNKRNNDSSNFAELSGLCDVPIVQTSDANWLQTSLNIIL